MEIKMTTTDTPRTDAVTLVKCYCPRCIVGFHNDLQLVAQYRKHAEWRERAEKAEAEVESLKTSIKHWEDQCLHFQHAWERSQAMYNKLIYTSTKPIESQEDDK